MAIVEGYEPNKEWSVTYLLFEETGEVTDLAGASLLMQFRPCADDDTLYAEASTTNNKIEFVPNLTTDNLQGIPKTGTGIKITLTGAETLAIFRGSRTATTDLEITFPSGEVESEVITLKLEPKILNTRPGFNIEES